MFFSAVKKETLVKKIVKSDELYVVHFDNGIVKVGKGSNAFSRVKQHMSTAAIFGNKVINFHVEKTPRINEQILIQFCCSQGTLVNGNEYFKHLDFDVVVNFLKKGIKRKVIK